jgi:hypothetical protein
MKSYILSFLTLTILLTTACKDDDCVAGSLETVIVGEWTVSVGSLSVGDVEFEANGNLIDPNGILIDGDVGGGVFLNNKSYNVESNSRFSVRADNGVDFVEYDIDVSDFNCDEIFMESLGANLKLSRN